MIKDKILQGLFWSEARQRATAEGLHSELAQPAFSAYDEPHTSFISVHLTWTYTEGHFFEGRAFRFSWDPGTKSFKYAVGPLADRGHMEPGQSMFQCANTPCTEGEFWYKFKRYSYPGDLITQRDYLNYWHGRYYRGDGMHVLTPAVARDLLTIPYYVDALKETFAETSGSVFDNPFKAALGGK